MRGVITPAKAAGNAASANAAAGWSRKVEAFKPLDVRLLVSLSVIEPAISNYEESDLEAGTVCQICMTPAGTINVGMFSGSSGSGTCYLSLEPGDAKRFKEGVHFEFA